MSSNVAELRCPLCEREVPRLSRHHLLPRQKGGKAEHVLPICYDCHNAVHQFFDNKQLAERYTSVDALLTEERFARHVSWLSKQNPAKRFRAARPRSRKR